MRLFYTKETQLQRDCLNYLRARGIFCWRQNSGALKTEKGFYRFTDVNGLPDIIAIIDGKFVGFEIKMPGKYPSKVQRATHAAIVKAGGEVHVIRSLDELRDVVDAKVAR